MGQKLSVARRGGGNTSEPQPPQPSQRGLWPSLLPASLSSNTATSSGCKVSTISKRGIYSGFFVTSHFVIWSREYENSLAKAQVRKVLST